MYEIDVFVVQSPANAEVNWFGKRDNEEEEEKSLEMVQRLRVSFTNCKQQTEGTRGSLSRPLSFSFPFFG